ncbi:MAG TPA: alpha-E domain-containing protein [Acidimicrobiales bacterium]|nr:alpha-E domain-containing protein [Acidimicrobiales bacterium]
MLSRIAEALFWMGRYLERADDTARMLDVQLQEMLDGPAIDEALAARALYSVMGIEAPAGSALDLRDVTASLAFDRDQPSSIVVSLVGARDNASTIRDTISSELWECLNATYLALEQRAATARATGPHAFFGFARFVKDRTAMATGIAEGTMPRDDSWSFLLLGRSLERADMTARLLSVRTGMAVNTSSWVGMLRSCSAHEAYLRSYGATVDAGRVAEFLLLDRLFPRSAYFALAEAEACLGRLGSDRTRLGTVDAAGRILGRARGDLEYRRIREQMDELPALLEALQVACSQASAALAARFFHRETGQAWRAEGHVVVR